MPRKPKVPPVNPDQPELTSLIAYCSSHPEQRFWQALTNWSGFDHIYGLEDGRERQRLDDVVKNGKFTLVDVFYRHGVLTERVPQ